MTARLWTPADLARAPVSWLDCDSARVDSDAQGVVGVYDRQGHLYRPLTGYAAHRLGVVHLNGRRWLGGTGDSDTNQRLALCALTASGWLQSASGVTLVAAFHRFQLASAYQGLFAVNNVDDSGAAATTQLQAMLRLAPASTANGNLLFNFRRLSTDSGGTKTRTTGLGPTGGFVASERLDAVNAQTSIHAGPSSTWGPLAADPGVTSGLLGGCSSSAYQVMFGVERANIAGAPDIALGEALLFDHALTDDEVARVEGYLAHRWGLTASLPETHAYKRVAPTVATLIPAPADESNAARQTYRAWLPNRAPAWLQRPNGKAWFWAHGDTLDSLEDAARVAVKARLPSHTTQDGLALLGSERRLERVPGESAESFARRVISAWTAWQHCGTPLGVLLALSVAGLDSARIHAPNGLTYSLDQDSGLLVEPALLSWPTNSDDNSDAIHPNWTIRAAPFWSEFELIIPANAWINSDTGDIILPNESDPAAQTIKRLVRQWKGAHCRCTSIIALKSEDAPLVGFPRRTIGTMAQSDETNTGGLWTQNKGWFDRAPNDFRAQWTMNAQ